MIIKNEYTIEELAAIAAKERVEISIDISPDNTSINIEPFESRVYWRDYWTTPTITTTPNPTWDATKVMCGSDGVTTVTGSNINIGGSSNTEFINNGRIDG